MRDALVIFLICVIFIAGGTWLVMKGDHEQVSPSGDVSFSVIDRGQHSGSVTERVNYRIQTAEEFVELWGSIHGANGVHAPFVDFAKSDVLAIFDGTHATGGYDVRVSVITDTTGINRLVSIMHESPGGTCAVTAALTSPYELVVVPKSASTLSREDTTHIVECD